MRRITACIECWDWIAAGRTGALPLRCQCCQRKRNSVYHARWRSKNREAERAYRRRYYHEHGDRIRAHRRAKWEAGEGQRRYALRQYGITSNDYESLLAAQEGRCAICEAVPSRQRLHVDHDHQTGAIRGLLCDACNRGIGSLKDDPEILLKAINYLMVFA